MRNVITTLGLVVALGAPAAAQTYQVDKAHSEAAFEVRHLLTKVRGTFRDFSGTIDYDKASPESSSVEFRIEADSIDTGVQKRDDHLRSADFFDVETHPAIVFKSTRISPTGDGEFEVTGDLTLHGVTKRITLPVSYLGEQKDPWGNTKAGFETEITLNRKDYGLNWNQALETGGFLVGDEVTVDVVLQAAKQAPAAADTN